MFFSCPHCRDLVATDRETNLPPVLCPRCGGVLRKETTKVPAKGNPSFASLLHGTAPAPAVAETDAPQPVQETTDDETGDSDKVEATTDDGPLSDAPNDEPSVGVDEIETTDLAPDEIATRAQEPAALSSATQYQDPSFTRQRLQPATPVHTAKWQWAALVVLAMTLALQVMVADRVRLAADASWRPMISSLCGLVGCSVPTWHQPGAFAMLSRDVSPISGTPGGLNVQATFRNDARWSQAWPVLLLSLSDADGRVLGSRAFSPKEYLGAAATQTELAPGQSAQIELKLHEPNPDVVAFSFDFR
ncbi:DUF3426 domain-containing protein [Pseudoxanthomonas sacheonensis]|uniref:DUF3426 domain-containing protein n=1 Tax=Pseudoxanthomonas sacheonensis TaxID=443615 RepID=A0ABU1RR74_9GAMM|nr:DUF3426 domain-containing protein [Pseudoxanthomonas sacheonensis]MDR6841268.1 hypothetical protein [Pseudoxanthomonas sacheonensis]